MAEPEKPTPTKEELNKQFPGKSPGEKYIDNLRTEINKIDSIPQPKQDKSPLSANTKAEPEKDKPTKEELNNLLFYAGSAKEVTSLIAQGAEVNTTNKDGMTPLFEAAKIGRTEVAQSLIENGAKVNIKDAEGWTPLHVAAENDSTKIAQLLIDHGAKANAKTNDGSTPLHSAAFNHNTEIVKSLIEHGGDVNAKTDKGGLTPLKGAIISGHSYWHPSSNADVINLLIDHGADVNEKDKKIGWTPLHEAAAHNSTENIALLIDRGADVNVTTKDGRTPLFVAIDFDERDAAKSLIERGADVSMLPNGSKQTLLEFAKVRKGPPNKFDERVDIIPILEKAEKNKTINHDKPEIKSPNQSHPEKSNTINWLAPLAALLGVLGINIVSGNGIGIGGIVTALLAAGAAALGTQAYNKTGLFAPSPTPVTKTPEPNAQDNGKSLDSQKALVLSDIKSDDRYALAAEEIFEKNPQLASDKKFMPEVMEAMVLHRKYEGLFPTLLKLNPDLAQSTFNSRELDGPLVEVLIQYDQSQALKCLLKYCPDVAKQKNSDGDSILQTAIKSNSTDCINVVLDKCPELVKERNTARQTVLESAIYNKESWHNYSITHIVKDILKIDPSLATVQDSTGHTIAYHIQNDKDFKSNYHIDDPEEIEAVLTSLKEATERTKGNPEKPKDKEPAKAEAEAQTSIDHPAMQNALLKHNDPKYQPAALSDTLVNAPLVPKRAPGSPELKIS